MWDGITVGQLVAIRCWLWLWSFENSTELVNQDGLLTWPSADVGSCTQLLVSC